MILTVCSLVTAYITLLLVIFIVKKDIENKYKTKIEFPFYMTISPWSFINKYGNIAISVVMIYLIEKKIIKKTKYYKKTTKIISRILYPAEAGWSSFIWDTAHAIPLSANPQASGE